jgi:cation transport regulator
MPYDTLKELPKSVRDSLPKHLQEIYKEAFNGALEQYGHEEERAHRVAWGAVRRQYHRDDQGKWAQGAARS